MKIFSAINRLLSGPAAIRNPDALARLNPNKIYLEQIRSIFSISSRSAQRYCDTAVRQGISLKYVEVVCPNGAIAASAESEGSLPETVRCWSKEYGSYRKMIYPTRDLAKNVFYRLINREARSSQTYSGAAQGLRSHSA